MNDNFRAILSLDFQFHTANIFYATLEHVLVTSLPSS